MKLGILGTSDIAYRRFLPALKKFKDIEYMGVASRTLEKCEKFQQSFGGKAYSSYDELLNEKDIDAVYVPLPPALHYEWGKKVLESGKHLLMEKPFTTSFEQTKSLLDIAKQNNLAVHENYMFLYHKQLDDIKNMIKNKTLGDIRLYKISFGFPMRGQDDFRYKKELGGGALLDCGGYPVRLAFELLGDSCKVIQSKLCKTDGFDVDIYGNAVIENEKGDTAQISFGMDNAYQCQLEVWGSKATLISPRIFTAGDGVDVKLTLRTSSDETNIDVKADDQFLHSIETFYKNSLKDIKDNYNDIEKQAMLTQAIINGGV